MTSALPATQKINEVQHTLEKLGGARRRYLFLAGFIRVVWLTVLAALIVVLVDAVLPMHGYLRLGLGGALGLYFIVGFFMAIPWRPESDHEKLHDARRLERIGKLRSNPILNAMFLSHLAEQHGDDLDKTLARRCVERGRAALQEADQQRLVDRRGVRREMGWLWMAVVLWAVVMLIQPRLVTGGFMRMASPLGAHPPFSPTEIDVTVNPDPVYEGDDATVTAEINGPVPELIELVEIDEQGNELRRWPMQPADMDALLERMSNNDNSGGEDSSSPQPPRDIPDAAFERNLQNLTEPMHFRIEAGRAQSQPFSIEPKPRSQQQDSQDGGTDQQDRQDTQDGNTDQQDTEDPGGSQLDELPEFAEKLDQLAQMMDQLRQRANELRDSMPPADSPEYEQWKQDMQDLQNQLQQMQQMAQELADMARDLAQSRPQLDDLLTRMAMQLDALGSCNMPGAGQGQNPGQSPGQNPGQGAQPGQNPGQNPGQGTSVAPGAGGQGTQSGTTGNWLMGLSNAAGADAITMDQMMQQLMNALSMMSSDGQSDTMPWPERDPVGRAIERLQGARNRDGQPDAVMRAVPHEYRPLTGRYFQRVAEDEDQQ